jgi:cell division protein FtsI/penicillin-binding protein 2
MAINEGKLNPLDTYYNKGYTMVGNTPVKNASGTERQVGTRTFREALDHSLNTGSIEALRKIGGENIPKSARRVMYDYLYNRFALGHKTGIEVYEEAGNIYSPDHEEGNAVRYSNMTFGHGMALTMVQVAAGFSAIINGGDYYQPTIIAGTMKDDKFVPEPERAPTHQAISPETSATMRDMLQEVRRVNSGEGDLRGYNIGVKTGTAETYDDQGKYTSKRTNVGAIGYGGSAKEGAMPEYVILVRMEANAALWGRNAVPSFTELSNYMLQYLRIEPVIK